MPTYSTVTQSTIFTKQQASTTSTTIQHKGGKKSILNSVVKRNLNFSPKAKIPKHVVQPRPFPSTQEVEEMVENMTGKSCTRSTTCMAMLDRRLLIDFKMTEDGKVFLLIIKVDLFLLWHSCITIFTIFHICSKQSWDQTQFSRCVT